MINEVSNQVMGMYKILVLNQDNTIANDYGWRKNLILDNGINGLFKDSANGGFTWQQASNYCHAGTGNTPFVYDQNLVTASASNSTQLSSSQGFFTSLMQGMLIKFDSGEEAKISIYNSPTQVTLDRVLTVTNQQFSVYAVNRNQLDGQLKTSNTYLTGVDYCGTTNYTLASTVVMRRTYNFTVETSNVNYSELGWQNNGVLNNLFSGQLINGGTITVLAGQYLRVVYDLIVKITPSSPTVQTPLSINVWPTSPATNTNYQLMICNPNFAMVDTNGNGSQSQAYQGEPGQNFSLYLRTSPSSSVPYPLYTDEKIWNSNGYTGYGNNKSTTAQSYIPGNFYRDFELKYLSSENNGTSNIVSFAEWCPNSKIGLLWQFEQAQTKTALQTVSFFFRKRVNRILTNN